VGLSDEEVEADGEGEREVEERGTDPVRRTVRSARVRRAMARAREK